jgi:hypothetical protein
VEAKLKKLVQQSAIFDRRGDHVTKRDFVAEQQTDWPEAGERPALAEQDAEIVAPGFKRALLEKIENPPGRNPVFRVSKNGGVQSGLA